MLKYSHNNVILPQLSLGFRLWAWCSTVEEVLPPWFNQTTLPLDNPSGLI